MCIVSGGPLHKSSSAYCMGSSRNTADLGPKLHTLQVGTVWEHSAVPAVDMDERGPSARSQKRLH